MKISKNILAGATLIGTIIGAGVFAIPYVFSRSGVITCLVYFLVLTPVAILLHLFFGEITLRTNEEQRLVGYTERYLGKKPKHLVAASIITGTIGSLLVYVILAGKFLDIIFPHFLSASQLSVLAWGVLAALVLSGTNFISFIEMTVGGVFLVVVALISLFCLPHLNTTHFVLFNSQKMFLPFGVFMFALVGWSVVGEVEDILTNKKDLKTVIIGAVLFCAVLYCIFGLIVSGVTGVATTPDSLSGLAGAFGYKAMFFGALFGLLAVGTSFLTLANYLKNTFIFDYKFAPSWAFIMACFPALLLFMAGLRNFVAVISVLGTIIGLVEGVSLVLIYKKSKKFGDRVPEFSLKTPTPLLCLIILILVGGTLVQLFYR